MCDVDAHQTQDTNVRPVLRARTYLFRPVQPADYTSRECVSIRETLGNRENWVDYYLGLYGGLVRVE